MRGKWGEKTQGNLVLALELTERCMCTGQCQNKNEVLTYDCLPQWNCAESILWLNTKMIVETVEWTIDQEICGNFITTLIALFQVITFNSFKQSNMAR